MSNTIMPIEILTRHSMIEQVSFRSNFIPRSFWLGGLKIDVVLDNTFIDQHNCVGQAIYVEQKIIIDPSKTPIQTTEQAFLHELVHWVFFMMNEHELRDNERLVDTFAHFLYQALSTSEPLSSSRIPRSPYLHNENYPLDSLIKEEFFHNCTSWWANSDDDFHGDGSPEDYDFISYSEGHNRHKRDKKWLFLEFEHPEIDEFPTEEDRIREEEMEAEEERAYHRRTEEDLWTDYSDNWARSDDDGWYYSDDE